MQSLLFQLNMLALQQYFLSFRWSLSLDVWKEEQMISHLQIVPKRLSEVRLEKTLPFPPDSLATCLAEILKNVKKLSSLTLKINDLGMENPFTNDPDSLQKPQALSLFLDLK